MSNKLSNTIGVFRIVTARQWVIALLLPLVMNGCFDSSTEDAPPALNNSSGGGSPSPKPVLTVINDTLSIPVGVTGEVSVLDNDQTPNGPFTIIAFDASTSNGGVIADLGMGVFSYTPSAGYEGQDNFTYTVKDNVGATATGMVTVTVSTQVIPNGKAFYAANCAVCHAAGTDDTSVAFQATDLTQHANPLIRDLTKYNGPYQLMGTFYDVDQKNIDELKAYLATL